MGPVFVLALNFGLSYFVDIYSKAVWFDNVMHYAGGFSIAVSAMIILMVARRRNYVGNVHWFGQILFAISFTALAAILWEICEFLSDELFGTTLQLSGRNIMQDMLFGLAGGLSGSFFMLFVDWRRNPARIG